MSDPKKEQKDSEQDWPIGVDPTTGKLNVVDPATLDTDEDDDGEEAAEADAS